MGVSELYSAFSDYDEICRSARALQSSTSMSAARPPIPAASARRAGLRYVDDRRPGIRRVRTSGGFRYLKPNGRPLRDRAALQRIRTLAFPPAYEDVWICPYPNGH